MYKKKNEHESYWVYLNSQRKPILDFSWVDWYNVDKIPCLSAQDTISSDHNIKWSQEVWTSDLSVTDPDHWAMLHNHPWWVSQTQRSLWYIFDRAPTLIIASYYSKKSSYYFYVYNIQHQLYHWILLSIRLIFLRSFHSIQTPLAPTVTTPTSFASFMKLLNYMLHLICGFITDKDTEKCVCIYLTRKLYIYYYFFWITKM